jgi:hypothetical protein
MAGVVASKWRELDSTTELYAKSKGCTTPVNLR